MNENLSFSIITAVRNNLSMLKLAIENLNTQKNVEFEHIIMDGNSSDGTKDFLVGIKDLRVVFKSEKDKSIYDALDKGMKESRNEIIGILHSDDFFSDEFVLQDVRELFEGGADIVYADLEYVDRQYPDRTLRHWRSGMFHPTDLMFGWMPPHPTFFFRRKVLERVGYYSLDFSIAADYEFMLRCLTKNEFKVAYLPRVITKMRLGGESNKSVGNIYLKSKQDYRIAKMYFPCALGVVLCKNLRKLKQIKTQYFS